MARLRSGSLAFVALLTLACTGNDPYDPGQGIGTFRVSATLVSSTCGATPNPWEFDVKLRHDAQTLYWIQGGAPVEGTVDAASRVVLASTSSQTLRAADPKTQAAACVVSRADELDVTLDAGDALAKDVATADAFAGSIAYTFTPQGDCSDQLTAVGGDYDALPCTIRYTIAAKRTGDAKP